MHDGFFYVHYAQAPVVGEWVVPWDELPIDLRALAGHAARVHEARFRVQWRSDHVSVHQLPERRPVLEYRDGVFHS